MDNNAPATDNPVDYIQHHLQPLAAGEGFWRINIDTIFFSALLASIVMFIAYRVGKSVSSGAPTGMQNVLETLIDFVNSLVKEAFPKPNKIVGPIGLTIFIWVLLMNAMDLIPVDLLPKLAHMMGISLSEGRTNNRPPHNICYVYIDFLALHLLQRKDKRLWWLHEIIYGTSFWYIFSTSKFCTYFSRRIS